MFRSKLATAHFVVYFLLGTSAISAPPQQAGGLSESAPSESGPAAGGPAESGPAEGAVTKAVLRPSTSGPNLLSHDRLTGYEQGFRREGQGEGDVFVCDNGADPTARRGLMQSIELNQTRPEPIVAAAMSKADHVSGSPDADYSLYLDLVYDDGTPLWGQSAAFSTATHDWQRREVFLLPRRPVKRITFYLLFRGHSGKASFRAAQLRVVPTPQGACYFDGVPILAKTAATAGFQVRDAAAGGDFVALRRSTLGLSLDCRIRQQEHAVFYDATVTDTTGRDRAITLVYAAPVSSQGLRWCEHPRKSVAVEPGREYVEATTFRIGSSGRLSQYPFAAVAAPAAGVGLGIDMLRPAFFRAGYHAATQEIYLAYDLGLTPQKPSATVRFCRFRFDPRHEFRGALDAFYRLFPEQFVCRTPAQGLWMPFAAISRVKGWEDFGFKFKEGHEETPWDDAHGILTFRYTEPMTWWMPMAKDLARTPEAAWAEAQRLAKRGDASARALLAAAYHDAGGTPPAQMLDTPWCNGAVWSINDMPGIAGEVTGFKNKWNPALREQLYGPKRRGDLDGEYIDSSEGYVTAELDFRREHFAAAQTPLVFSQDTHRPAIFRGLIAFEYVRAIADDVHRMDKWMMANATPSQLCWLTPLLDVLGTETDWNPQGRWSPMPDAELLYRRALCAKKPYCFLMNSAFEKFPSALVEKYMKRSLAYGMFPGFFSHNAAEGHYFSRPELYERDRPLFKKYLPLCKRAAEAGWEPITRARSNNPRVYVERFGPAEGTFYLTVLNDSDRRQSAEIAMETPCRSVRELVGPRPLQIRSGRIALELDPQDVALVECRP